MRAASAIVASSSSDLPHARRETHCPPERAESLRRGLNARMVGDGERVVFERAHCERLAIAAPGPGTRPRSAPGSCCHRCADRAGGPRQIRRAGKEDRRSSETTRIPEDSSGAWSAGREPGEVAPVGRVRDDRRVGSNRRRRFSQPTQAVDHRFASRDDLATRDQSAEAQAGSRPDRARRSGRERPAPPPSDDETPRAREYWTDEPRSSGRADSRQRIAQGDAVVGQRRRD